MKTAFIGHRKVFALNISEKLTKIIEIELDKGCRDFIMGMHGEFDKIALHVCKQLRNEYKDMQIEVAVTSLNVINKYSKSKRDAYDNVKTVMYDIEEAHYKQRITLSNRQMIDECDTLICYVDNSAYRSGAKTALRYAEKRGLKIINLYNKEDRPFYGMFKEEIKEYIKNL